MTPDHPSSSRVEAIAALFADLAREPVTWRSLLEATRRAAPRVRAIHTHPVFLSPADRDRAASFAPKPATPAEAPSSEAMRRMILFLFDLHAAGMAEAIGRAFDDLSTTEQAPAFLATLNRFIEDADLPRDLSSEDLIAINRDRLEAGVQLEVLLGCLAVLGLSKKADFAVRRAVFFDVALPRLRAAAQTGRVDTMLGLETALYGRYLKVRETREHHLETLDAIEKAVALLPPGERLPQTRPTTARPPRIVFMIPNGIILAHTELLLSFLSGLGQLEDRIIEPVVLMYLDRKGGALGRKLDEMGVRWIGAGLSAPSAYEALFDKIRSMMTAIAADAVVFVSTPLFIPYFTKRPLAPKQIWWPMKFMLPLFDGLDGRVSLFTMSDSAQVIEGRLWLGGPISMPPPPAADPDQVAAIRARFPGQKILGTIGREEKIADVGFLNTVVEILRRHPDTCFVWTGRERLPEIDAVFAGAGVGERCHFVGWIEPSPYLSAFDLVIETPLTGLMFGWAMALGTPVISIGPRGWLGVYLAAIFDGSVAISDEHRREIDRIFAPILARFPGLWASDADQAAHFADLLLNDSELRSALGEAQKAYVNAFMVGEAESAAIQARHFAAIARDASSN